LHRRREVHRVLGGQDLGDLGLQAEQLASLVLVEVVDLECLDVLSSACARSSGQALGSSVT
jgi:hypothetical protein